MSSFFPRRSRSQWRCSEQTDSIPYSGSRYNVRNLPEAEIESDVQIGWDLNSLQCMVRPAGTAISPPPFTVNDQNSAG